METTSPDIRSTEINTYLNTAVDALNKACSWYIEQGQLDNAQNFLNQIKELRRMIKVDPGIVDGLAPREQTMALGGRRIEAIKEIRARTGCGLKEGKDLVEAYLLKHERVYVKPENADNRLTINDVDE